MKISTPKNTRELLERHNFSFKKMFGQNFLIDGNILRNIVKNAEITKDTAVIEIGPGIGALTQYIGDAAGKVVCFEIDTRLEELLKETLGDYDNITVVFEDFLKADVEKIINEQLSGYKEIIVVANLPYYITTPIISKIIESDISVDRMVLMMQSEVGNRLSAKPKSKEYGSLSIFIQYYCAPKVLMKVPRNAFIPQPNVDSIVIGLKKHVNPPVEVVNEELFFELVKTSFNQRRKMLRNNLKKYDLKVLEEIFEELGLSLTLRAEALSIQDYANISNEMHARGV